MDGVSFFIIHIITMQKTKPRPFPLHLFYYKKYFIYVQHEINQVLVQSTWFTV
jgi:hypothetical protein